MTTIARPNIELTAKDRTGRAFQSLRNRFQRLTGNTKALLGTLAGLAGAAGFGALVKGSLDAADKLQKLSIRLGATTEALSEYQHVAELSGVSFNTLTMGWQRMTRRIAEAAAGFGEARGALDELGLSAAALNNLSPDQQFEVLADALAGVKNEADRVRLAMKLFDSEGVALIQTMTQGAAGIRDMRAEARELGLTLTQDAADGAANANDAIARLKAATSGAARVFLLELAPYIEGAANVIREHLIPALSTAREWLDKLGGFFNTIRGYTAKALSEMILSSDTTREKFGDLGIVFKHLSDEWLNGAKAADKAGASTLEYTRNAEGALIPTIRISKAANDGAAALDNLGESGKKTAGVFTGLYTGAIDDAMKSWKVFVRVHDHYNPTSSLEEVLTVWDKLGEAIPGVASDSTAAIEQTTQSIFDMDEALRNVQNNIQTGFSDLFVDLFSGKGVDSFKDFARRVFDIFKRLLADMAAAWITSKIFKMPANFGFDIGSIFGGGGGSGGGMWGAIGKKILEKIGIGGSGGGSGGSGTMSGVGQAIKTWATKTFGWGAGSTTSAVPSAVGSVKGPAVLNYGTGAYGGGALSQGGAAVGNGFGGGAVGGNAAASSAGSAWGAAAGAAVVAAIGVYGFGKSARKDAMRIKRQQEFFTQVGTGTSESLGESGFDYRGMLNDAEAFFSTTREGWRSTIEALSEAGLLTEGWGAMLDENGRGLVKINGDIEGIKGALSNAQIAAFDFAGSLTNAVEKGNNLRVSITGDSQAITNALHAATAAGIGGFTNLERTGTGVSATLTGDMEKWNQFLQSAVNASIQAAASSMGRLADEASGATSKFLELARAAAKVQSGGSVSVRAPGFNEGGSFIVRGRAGRDRNLVPLRLTHGERVTITPANQVHGQAQAPTRSSATDNQVVQELRGMRSDLGKVLQENARLRARLAGRGRK